MGLLNMDVLNRVARLFIAVVKLLYSWGPLFVFTLTVYISSTAVYSLIAWWHPWDSLGGFLNIVFLAVCHVLGVYNFCCCALIGPGFLCLNWKPENVEDEQYLSYCKVCKGYKAPRAHHCRKCKRCVLKMDHHCPWVNNCCGHRNHAYLVQFLVVVICALIQILVILYYALIELSTLIPNPERSLRFNIFLLAASLSFGIMVATVMLLFIIMRTIVTNQTQLERAIVKTARRSGANGNEFVYPYDFGYIRNLKLAFCSKRKFNYDDDVSNGIVWKVKEGCNQYTLTIEGIRQSNEKRSQSKEFAIVNPFDGSWFPLTMGFGVMFCFPLLYAPRMPVNIGDRVFVSRFKRYWLYGELEVTSSSLENANQVRGWFPRSCAVEVINRKFVEDTQVQEGLSKKNE